MKINRQQALGIWSLAVTLDKEVTLEIHQPNNGQDLQVIARFPNDPKELMNRVYKIHASGGWQPVAVPEAEPVPAAVELDDPDEIDL